MMKASALVITIKAVGHLNSCFLLLDLGVHISFQSPKKLEAALMVDTTVLQALIPPETIRVVNFKPDEKSDCSIDIFSTNQNAPF
jgi:hypothetical protein